MPIRSLLEIIDFLGLRVNVHELTQGAIIAILRYYYSLADNEA